MNYLIIQGGIIENIIVADEAFAEAVGSLPTYPGAAIGQPYNPPPAPAEQLRADVDFIAAMTGVRL